MRMLMDLSIATSSSSRPRTSNILCLCMNNYKVRYDGNSYNIVSKDCSSETVQIDASMVEFTPSDSNWQVTNVKEALDYLYEN